MVLEEFFRNLIWVYCSLTSQQSQHPNLLRGGRSLSGVEATQTSGNYPGWLWRAETLVNLENDA